MFTIEYTGKKTLKSQAYTIVGICTDNIQWELTVFTLITWKAVLIWHNSYKVLWNYFMSKTQKCITILTKKH
jgi:hypothetical protein